MLRFELSNKPYIKIRMNEAIQKATGRSKSSVEFKNHNISAVLRELGMPWIRGDVPRVNYQRALLDGIERQLLKSDPLIGVRDDAPTGLREGRSLFVEQAPAFEAVKEKENENLQRLVRKFDPAERDANNRLLGMNGEELVLHHERNRLIDLGQTSLAKKVRWVSKEDGDGAGYDILSFEASGEERLLEVKTTRGYQKTPFYLSRNEHELSNERPEAFRIMRLYDFSHAPRMFELAPPPHEVVRLRPESYKAFFS